MHLRKYENAGGFTAKYQWAYPPVQDFSPKGIYSKVQGPLGGVSSTEEFPTYAKHLKTNR
jgi:hypothetical protein